MTLKNCWHFRVIFQEKKISQAIENLGKFLKRNNELFEL
jgi:hypothetical protein